MAQETKAGTSYAPGPSSSLLDHALAYAARGWPVFPLHTPDTFGGCSCRQRETCGNAGKHPRTLRGLRDASTDPEQIRQWWEMWPEANIGVVTGERSGLVVLDVDPQHGGDESLKRLLSQHDPFPKQLWARTGGGGWHICFAHPGVRIGNIQSAPDRPGKFGVGLDIRGDGGYIVAPPSLHRSGAYYRWGTDCQNALPPIPDWLLGLLAGAARESSQQSQVEESALIAKGARNSTLTSIAGSMRRRGMSEEAIFAALVVENERRCYPPLTEREVRAIAHSIARYAPGESLISASVSTENSPRSAASLGDQSDTGEIPVTPWPAPPAPAAFHGLAGEIVRLIEPHSEADPVALLAQMLIAFGNVIGRNAHFVAEGDHHYLNLFAVMVGATSKGRKGTSWARIRSLCSAVDGVWTLERVQSGLSTGEGLIWAVRDQIERREPIREKSVVKDYQTVIIDPGVSDKRLLAVEPEFASCLRVFDREGNTLSALIRQAWDTGALRALTKNSPAKATGAHISIIGHITRDELRRYLDTTEAANGFANRFLWLCVRRSKALPEGGGEAHFGDLVTRLHAAIRCARQSDELKRDAEARTLWRKIYEDLSEGKPGLLGAVISRAEAQVMRLACLYALLDCSPEIRRVHLEAALALWRYCEDSVRFIFGDSLGDPVADEILRALKEAGESGLTQTELNDLFSGNRHSGALARSLTSLLEAGHVVCRKEETGGRGRPTKRWFALRWATKKTEKTEKMASEEIFWNFSVFSVPQEQKADQIAGTETTTEKTGEIVDDVEEFLI